MSKEITNESIDYIKKQQLDYFFSGTPINLKPLGYQETERIKEPELASHLVSSRGFYDHHGLYVGNGEVIHYSGLADGLNSGPVELIKLTDFQTSNNEIKGYDIIPHPNAKYDLSTIIENAYKRLNEKDYNLVWNNCEHFVHECIYGYGKSKQVIKVFKKAGGKTADTIELFDTFFRYIKGETSSAKFREDIASSLLENSLIDTKTLTNKNIKIPTAPLFAASTLSFSIANILLSNANVALQTLQTVKVAKERRREVEELCGTLKKQVRQSQRQLEVYFETYFNERHDIIGNALLNIEAVDKINDLERFNNAIADLNQLFGKTLNINGFDEFDEIMVNDKSLSF